MFTNSHMVTCVSFTVQGWVLKATVQWALWSARFSVYFQCGVGPRVFTMGAREILWWEPLQPLLTPLDLGTLMTLLPLEGSAPNIFCGLSV